ncbi:MAG: hypothetical protein O9353_15600 [Bacteroidia bacterium]|nr:hypothetical protein [Bacteroidia bacterium]
MSFTYTRPAAFRLGATAAGGAGEAAPRVVFDAAEAGGLSEGLGLLPGIGFCFALR